MKRIFTLLTFLILTTLQGFSQEYVDYDRDSRWFIGLNVGGTWTTQTEVDYRLRGGYGFTFGKSFGMEPNKMFSWDLRARFLHAQFQGQSTNRYSLDSTTTTGLSQYGPAINTYQDSLGYFIPNHKTNLVRGSMELVLNTNRLRQRTGWNLSVFGGIGITGYHTTTDLLDESDFFTNSIYNYDELNSTSQSNLLQLQDQDYETDLVGDEFEYEVDWMPSFGFGISKQVHPAVSLGFEHKMTWTRSNTFDGLSNNLNGTASTENDIYHYTSFGIKFHLLNGRRTTETDVVEDLDPVDDPVDTTPIIDEPVKRKKPIVDIYDPGTSPYTVTTSTFKLKANVYYVDGRNDITFKQDGNINTNFSYNATTDKFESTVVLHPGQNLFEITGVNTAGSDYESVIIVYKEEEKPLNPPIVTITNPPYTPYYTSSNIFGLVSTVLNVETKSQIRVYLNGVNLNAFSYDHDVNTVNASLNLKEGKNTVTVTATNEAGSDSKTVELIYRKPKTEQPPIVSFVNPGSDPYYTTISSINIRATALHVANKTGLDIRVNGNVVNAYSFNTETKEILFNTSLINGANIVEITGTNTAGTDSESTTIIYSRPETPQPPVVSFVDPNTDPLTVYSSTYNVTAKVKYVASASDITLKINGATSTLFTYSTSSDLMNFSTGLLEGANIIEITGTNEYGEDTETTTIIYKRTIPQAPPIVNITNPAVDNVVFEFPELTLNATVLNVSSAANISVIVNGAATTDFTYNNFTKQVNVPLVLIEGSNTVQITGTNAAGTDTKVRLIIYEKPTVPSPPTVNFTNPASSPYASATETYTVTAATTHIDGKGQIVLKQNGVLISDASYSFIGGDQISYNATLVEGSNVFEISVENTDGAASDLTIINYEKDDQPCIIPTVGYISPVPYSTVEEATVTVDAQINNYSAETTVELKLNGVSKGFMTYNAGTSVASKAVTLTEGSNAITVIVTNDCGTNQATFILNYEAPDAPCVDPVVSTTGVTTITTLEEEISLTATAVGVEDAEELTVKVNGVITDFTFDAATGTITIPEVALIVGGNVVTITAKTECGGTVLVFNIMRENCEVPSIGAITPTTGTTTESAAVTLNTSIANATAGDITLTVNGIAQTFSYNNATGALTQGVALNVGANTIVIAVENVCGTDTETIVITREIPCETIVTNLLEPAVSEITVTEDTFDLLLHASGISSVEQVTASLNGTPITPAFDAVSGNITLEGLSLVDGENTVTVGLANDCSSETVNYTINYEGCVPPVIIVNGMAPGMTVTDGVFHLFVTITNVSSADDITVNVNGSPIDFDFNPASHLLEAEFTLLQGNNEIDIQANGCEIVSTSTDLTYEEPCETITYSLLSPAANEVTALEESYNITLTAAAVENASEITVTLNGANVPFTFNVDTKIVTIAGLSLTDGANAVSVIMNNDCSTAEVNYTINYDGCEPPVISWDDVSDNVEVARYEIAANATNVENAAAITLTLNGAPVPFVFDPVTGNISAEVDLSEGENTIVIAAAGCENAERTENIIYTIPCTELVYTLGHPAETSAEVADEVYYINLIAQHVTESGITVKLNGTAVPFTYVDNLITANGLTLIDGENSITVELENACSNEVINYSISHEDCSTPEIGLGANALSTESAGYNFTANLTGVERADQIRLTVNGVETDFDFTEASGTLIALITLNEGENVIQVEANGCASATETIRVVYTVPCDPVTYSLVAPTNLNTETSDEQVSISLNTTGVAEETIIATLNGASVDAEFSGGMISMADLPLEEGTNVIAINFGNACSEETVTFTVNYAPCTIPVIVINGLTDGMVLVDQELVFFADITEVEDAGDIVLRFNGSAVPFDFNPASNMLQAPLTLNEGSNSIEIIVNGCEEVIGGVDVVYNPPCLAPSYTLVTPTETAVTAEGELYTITMNVANVTEDQISVTVNGLTAPFTYSSGTLVIEVPFLTVMTNAASVTLTNDCGTASVDFVVTFTREEEVPECMSTVSADFIEDNRTAIANSDKDLSNVVLKFEDGTTQKFEGLSGYTGTFSGTGANVGKCIVGVWIKSGCNQSGDGPGYGAYVANDNWDGTCAAIEAPCDPITYTFVNPTKTNVSTTESTFTVSVNTVNVTDLSEIVVQVNGKTKTPDFNGTTITLANIKLNNGVNTMDIALSNACSAHNIHFEITKEVVNPEGTGGTDNNGGGNGNDNGGGKTKGVIDQGAIAPPVIQPIYPKTSKITVDDQTMAFKATVHNVSSRSDITLMVNGKPLPVFNYSSKTKQVSAVVRLNLGMNLIKLQVSNGKIVEQSFYVTYEKKAVEQNISGQINNKEQTGAGELTPKLQRLNPAGATYTTDKSTFALKAKGLNVRSKSNITIQVNNQRITNFTFNNSTKIISAVLRLKEGANRVKITAKNGVNQDVLSYTITYKKAVAVTGNVSGQVKGSGAGSSKDLKPVFKSISPSSTSKTVKNPTFTLKVKVSNVSEKSDIKMMLNGSSTTGFTFNRNTGEIIATLRLKEGNNSVSLTAKNGKESATIVYTIKYAKATQPVKGGTLQNKGGNTGGGEIKGKVQTPTGQKSGGTQSGTVRRR